jgi:hypothetical protein
MVNDGSCGNEDGRTHRHDQPAPQIRPRDVVRPHLEVFQHGVGVRQSIAGFEESTFSQDRGSC